MFRFFLPTPSGSVGAPEPVPGAGVLQGGPWRKLNLILVGGLVLARWPARTGPVTGRACSRATNTELCSVTSSHTES